MAEDTTAPHPEAARPRVVIVGAGFAGLFTALALAAQPQAPTIVLIEPRERFLFLPLLYELLSAELPLWQVAPRYDEILAGQGIAWLAERVEKIDAEAGWVQTGSGRRLAYDRLVLACGGVQDHFGIPGAEGHSLGFRTLADVSRLQELLADLRRQSRPLQRLAVVGAGPTGVELACKLADLAAGTAVIELIEQGDIPLAGAPAFNREQALLALQRRDVRLRCRTRVTALRADALTLRHRDTAASAAVEDELLPANGVIWTAGLRFRAPLITPAPAQDRLGRLLCGPDLRLNGHERIFVAGDLALPQHAPGPAPEAAAAAAPAASAPEGGDSAAASGPVAGEGTRDPSVTGAGSGARWTRASDGMAQGGPEGGSTASPEAPPAPLPASAQVAFQQSALLAANLRRSLAGEPLEPFQWRNLGEMLSLGRGDACLTAGGFTLAGPAAYQLRRLAYLTRLPGLGQQLRAAAAWAVEALP